MDGKITILIEGKPVGLKFAFPCVRWFSDESQKQPDIYFIETDSGPSMTDYGLAKLMQCAYRNQCLLSEVNPDIKFEKFVEFVESKNNQEGAEELGRIMTVYAESSVSKRVVESSEKKKPTLKGDDSGVDFEAIESIMYGELSIKPWELHRMTFRDVMLSIDGVNKKREREYNNLSRLAVVVAHSGMNAKHAVNIMKKAFPPLGEPADTLAERARRALKRAQEFDIKQKLNAGRT